MKRLFQATAFLLFITSCTSTKKVPEKTENWVVAFSFSKGPCYGRCPVYNLTLFENRWLEYQGVQHTERTGYFYQRLEKKVYTDLVKKLNGLDWAEFDQYYPNPVADFPVHKLQVGANIISGNQVLPETVQAVMAEIDALTQEGAWIERPLKTEL